MPEIDEATGGGGFRGQRTTDSADCAAVATEAEGEKAFATLLAELAIVGGFTLLELTDGSYLVTKWNCCRPLADLRAVAAFVRQVGGAA